MGVIDAATWQALGVLLTGLGLLISVVVWRRRGATSGLRVVAWSLLPAAAALTGTLKLLWQIGTNILDWAVRLVFSPVVWLGIALAGVSLMLFAVTAALRARGVGVGRREPERLEPGRREPGQLARRRTSAPAEPAAPDDDLGDIEAILRRRGIT